MPWGEEGRDAAGMEPWSCISHPVQPARPGHRLRLEGPCAPVPAPNSCSSPPSSWALPAAAPVCQGREPLVPLSPARCHHPAWPWMHWEERSEHCWGQVRTGSTEGNRRWWHPRDGICWARSTWRPALALLDPIFAVSFSGSPSYHTDPASGAAPSRPSHPREVN